jgi:hypothetical protein
MELKVVCACGQKYKFDVEPVGGQMPFTVNCPVCQQDGTATANQLLAQMPPPPIAPPPMAPAPTALRINVPTAEPATAYAAPPRAALRPVAAPQPAAAGEFILWRGILGALLGAGLGAGLMYGFFLLAEFRFPLMGTGIGALTGLGARLLYKGTDSTLGIIAGAIALLATAGTLYLMFGDIAGMFIISMVVSVSFAYKIAG